MKFQFKDSFYTEKEKDWAHQELFLLYTFLPVCYAVPIDFYSESGTCPLRFTRHLLKCGNYKVQWYM